MTDAVIAPQCTPEPAVLATARRRGAVRAGFVAWIVGCLVVGGYLLSAHLLTLPKPESGDPGLSRAVAAARQPAQRGQWLALHILDQECKCSLQVLDHLLAGPRPAGIAERIVLIAGEISPDRAAAIRGHGFELDVVTPDQLVARYHVEAAPLLVIADPADEVRYVGGYTPRKQAADVRDAAIIDALKRGQPVTPLPTFGCVVGRKLRTAMDPLGLRSWK